MEIVIALIVGFGVGSVFASGFPADGAKRRDSGGTTDLTSSDALCRAAVPGYQRCALVDVKVGYGNHTIGIPHALLDHSLYHFEGQPLFFFSECGCPLSHCLVSTMWRKLAFRIS